MKRTIPKKPTFSHAHHILVEKHQRMFMSPEPAGDGGKVLEQLGREERINASKSLVFAHCAAQSIVDGK